MAPTAGWGIKLPLARFVSGAERVMHRDKEEKRRKNVEVDFYRPGIANEDALLINLLLKKKNEQCISEDA